MKYKIISKQKHACVTSILGWKIEKFSTAYGKHDAASKKQEVKIEFTTKK